MHMTLIIFISFFLFHSHIFFTLAEPLARSEELNRNFLGLRSAITTGGIAAIITLACITIFKTSKQPASTEGFGCFPMEVLRCFSFGEIQAATANFSLASFSRREGFRGVYAGLIDEGKQKVVVKRLSLELWNEIKEVLSKLWHGNLVSLIGYCNKSGNMFLVYEDGMSLGTLADNLNTNTNTRLSWEQRLRICIEVARGLDYLHTGTDHGAIHGDLKCSNILLYENYKPKISDFRLTKLNELDQKLDVCSFGVVLLELLCGKIQPQHISWARICLLHDLVEVDPHIKGQISAACLKKIKAISEKCLHEDPKKRPSMAQVVARLELLLEGEASSSSRPRNKEPVVHDNVHQSMMMERFQTATNNFSNTHILLNWGVYTIYRGTHVFLPEKKISSYVMYVRGMHMPPTPDEISKLDKISNLSHKNLASMVGYCSSGGKIIVVGYENEGGGILYHKLSHSNQSWYNDSLPWEKRLEICIGAAKALRFLHEAKIIHGCITASTILLDSKYHAKLATFGSMSTHYTFDRVVFMPLDIAGSTTPTEKTDVYLFGLLLYIVLCGKNVDYTHGYPFLLPATVKEAADSNTLRYVTDINMSSIAERCLREFLRVAASCTSTEPRDRLSMDAVVEGLKKARALQIHR